MFFWKKEKVKNFAKLSKGEREKLTRQYLDEGNLALEKDKVEAALESFRQLIRLEPTDPDHRRRLADCHNKLGDKKAELEARCKAATLYAEAGFLLKGIAMCKLALAIDPSHQQTQKQLADLNALCGRQEPIKRLPQPKPTSAKDEESRKDRALAEARARVERVRAERAKRAAAQKLAQQAPKTETDVADDAPTRDQALDRVPPNEPPHETTQPNLAPSSEAPPPSVSFESGTPLDAVPLHSAFAHPGPPFVNSAPDLVDGEDDDEIFIAPLDEDDIREETESANVASAPPAPPSQSYDAPESESSPASASEVSERPNLATALERVPLLSALSRESFVMLIEELGFQQLAAGDVLFEVGSPADSMYCVVEGEVAACLDSSHSGEIELGRLREGDFFGEIGLLAEQPRKARIVARKETMLLKFERQVVGRLCRSEPEFITVLLRFVRERLVASLIATNPLFAPFEGAEAEDLTRRFQFLEVRAKKPLVRQGVESGGVYILLSGEARVVHSSGGQARELGLLKPGDIFGEMSLINRTEAVASVITTSKSFVLRLPAKDFTQLVMMHPALLAYVSSLASERQAQNEAALSGAFGYREDTLDLM